MYTKRANCTALLALMHKEKYNTSKENKMDKEKCEEYNNRWEGYKVWERLNKPVDIDTEDFTKAKAVIDKVFAGWRKKYGDEKK